MNNNPPLSRATVTTLRLGSVSLTNTSARVNDLGLDDDQVILDELADVLARVCVGNVGEVGGVEVDLALAHSCDRGSEPLLLARVGHCLEPKRR
jgi:hypothetical protein